MFPPFDKSTAIFCSCSCVSVSATVSSPYAQAGATQASNTFSFSCFINFMSHLVPSILLYAAAPACSLLCVSLLLPPTSYTVPPEYTKLSTCLIMFRQLLHTGALPVHLSYRRSPCAPIIQSSEDSVGGHVFRRCCSILAMSVVPPCLLPSVLCRLPTVSFSVLHVPTGFPDQVHHHHETHWHQSTSLSEAHIYSRLFLNGHHRCCLPRH